MTRPLYKALAALPGAALGLYTARVMAELWALQRGALPFITAIALGVLGAVAGTWLLRRVSWTRSWPALILLIYVLYPEAQPLAAATVGGVCAVAWWRVQPGTWLVPSKWRVAAIAVVLFFLVLYVTTLAPDVLPADSGELQLVATNLGVAHPPGFPLYTVLAHLMTRLPVGPSPAYRVNLLSAITGAATLGLVYAAVWLLNRSHLAAFTAAAGLGAATTFWAQATTANIRSLTAFFAALMLFALLAHHQVRAGARTGGAKGATERYLILFALGLGLGVTHHASLAFMGLVFVLFLLAGDAHLLRTPSRWWRPLLALLLGLLPLFYLPWRASSGARGAAAELATWPGFLEHVLALGFRGDLFVYLQPALLWERLQVMANVLAFQFDPILLAGMVAGFLLLLWARRWSLALLLGGSFLLHLVVTATYRAPQTVEYMLPAYVPLVLLLGYAAGWRDLQTRRLPAAAPILPALVTAVLLVFAGRQALDNAPSYLWLHGSTDTRDYAQTLLADAPPGATVLADWHWVTSLWYLQEVEGQRLDLDVRFVFPEGEAYGQTWARRIATQVENGQDAISTHYDAASYAELPLSEPLGEAFLFRQEPLQELPSSFAAQEHNWGGQIELLGFALADTAVEIGQEATLTLAWRPLGDLDPATMVFAHLVGTDGRLYGQQDVPARHQDSGLTLTQLRLAPRLGAAPGTYTVYAGAYAAEAMLDEDGQPRTAVAELSVTPMAFRQTTLNPLPRRPLDPADSAFVGYDWDHSSPGEPRLYLHWRETGGYVSDVVDGTMPSLPAYVGPWGLARQRWDRVMTPRPGYYVPFAQGIVWHDELLNPQQEFEPGDRLTLEQQFLSSRPVLRDYAVSVRLIGYEEDGYHWAWWDLDDSIPAMGAIPTLKWVAGSRVRSPHFLEVSDGASPAQELGGALTLYDAFTSRPLPILDDRLTALYPWVPLGRAMVASP